ncbi:MAG: hypothetical protein Q9194_004880 [Teloschistes cf. exilis]
MSLLKTIPLAHVPGDVEVHVALFENVKNAGFLQQQLLNGNNAFEYAFIDASVSIEGVSLPFDDSEIARFTDMANVQKIYKLTGAMRGSEGSNSKRREAETEKKGNLNNMNGTSGKEDAERKRLEMLVLGLMALRGAT